MTLRAAGFNDSSVPCEFIPFLTFATTKNDIGCSTFQAMDVILV